MAKSTTDAAPENCPTTIVWHRLPPPPGLAVHYSIVSLVSQSHAYTVLEAPQGMTDAMCRDTPSGGLLLRCLLTIIAATPSDALRSEWPFIIITSSEVQSPQPTSKFKALGHKKLKMQKPDTKLHTSTSAPADRPPLHFPVQS